MQEIIKNTIKVNLCRPIFIFKAALNVYIKYILDDQNNYNTSFTPFYTRHKL